MYRTACGKVDFVQTQLTQNVFMILLTTYKCMRSSDIFSKNILKTFCLHKELSVNDNLTIILHPNVCMLNIRKKNCKYFFIK